MSIPFFACLYSRAPPWYNRHVNANLLVGGISDMEARRSRKGEVILIVIAILILAAGSLWVGSRDFDAYNAKEAPRSAEKASGAVTGMANGVEYGEEVFMSAYDTDGVTRDAGAVSGAPVQAVERKIVRSASLTLNSAEYDAALAALKTLITDMDGYLSDSYERGDVKSGETRSATLTLRVPSDKLDGFLAGAGGIARVVSRSESSTDMTVQYADNEARLGTLKAKLQRLNELMLKAETASDLIELESAISDTQYEIDSYETRQRTIDRDVNMSEISVTLREETPAESAAAADKSLGARLSSALSASFKGIGEFLRNMLVFVVMALPVIVPLAVIITVIALVRRARRRGSDAASKEQM